MRRGLIWVLGATVLASVAALAIQRPTTSVVPAVDSTRNARAFSSTAGADTALAAKSPLPPSLPRWHIEPAKRDPFADAAAVAAPALPAAPPPVAQAVSPPPPPPMAWRYLGTMNTPDGTKLVMLGRENDPQAVIVERGTRLSDGYEVLSVNSETIRLMYPPLQHEVVLAIPPPPAANR